jgi:drug/metabolite transporter (DMT)-like permease
MGLHLSGNLFKAIGFKLASTLLFAIMSVLVRLMGEVASVGQIVFFRGLFAIVPVLLIYAYRGQVAAAIYTRSPFGQLLRGLISATGMFANFGALVRIPLAEVTAIGFASPLMIVALAAILLKERVRIFRWSAVAVGFVGVVVMLIPNLDFHLYTAATAATVVGSLLALLSAFTNSAAVIQTRRLVRSETTPSIVFYFSLICAIAGAVTLPFSWHTPTLYEFVILAAIGVMGGYSHILLTESYRFAPASVVAPFDYTSMIWAVLFGYWMFDEVPGVLVFIGAAIVVAAGLFVIWRERQLGIQRAREAEGPSAPI